MKNSFSRPILRAYLFLALVAFFVASAFQQPQPVSGLSPWAWILIIVVLVFIVAWLLMRGTRQSTPPPASHTQPTSHAEPASPIQTFDVPSEAPAHPQMDDTVDDLTIIEGIGPKIGQLLSEAGIKTFAQLAETDPARLEEILKENQLQMIDPSTWNEQARLAAAGDLAGLKALQDRLSAGREV